MGNAVWSVGGRGEGVMNGLRVGGGGGVRSTMFPTRMGSGGVGGEDGED